MTRENYPKKIKKMKKTNKMQKMYIKIILNGLW